MRYGVADDEKIETFRVEIRYDFTGTLAEVQAAAVKTARSFEGGAVTAIFDEDWNEVQ